MTENLSVTIENRPIVNNVSFTAASGEVVALVGASGSGKTTLLNCVGLIRKPSKGAIVYDGADFSRIKDKERTKFWRDHATFIYQDYGVIDDESVAFNVTFSKFNVDKPRLSAALGAVGLAGRQRDKAAVLSGGEKQRLGIARSIYKQADVIFADEPTASLDSANRNMVIDLLRARAADGAMVLVATHDERLADACDRVVSL